ncbi:hypothetical protein [Pantoea sp. Aalb]|uniref:hypothetical protein n=1 Tax=Pantoea sp. Aalb TaxID=2576762 RepID=UPI001359F3F4|nr:hypothetical protein [Pantoea sp. Aalb]
MNKLENLYFKVKYLVPSDVTLPVRFFIGISHSLLFVKNTDGHYLYDLDDKMYIDHICS